MNDLLFIVPSRGRPENIQALIPCWKLACGFAELLVAVDDDDPKLEEYEKLNVPLVVGPRLGITGTLNELATSLTDAYMGIGFMGDDHRPRTPFWDKRMFEALSKLKTGVVYGNDLLQGEELPTQVLISTDIIKSLGFMAPPTLEHLFLDNFWKELGKSLGRLTYLEDVVIEHLHPTVGKSEWDESYRRHNSNNQFTKDSAAFEEYMANDFIADVDRIPVQ